MLRVTDPRFTAFVEFGDKVMADDEIFRIVKQIFKVVPPILMERGKVKDPWPNVDASSGALLFHYGMTEFEYYTVLFSVSRVIGLAAQLIMNRAMLAPIIRPKSVTTKWVRNLVNSKKEEPKKEGKAKVN